MSDWREQELQAFRAWCNDEQQTLGQDSRYAQVIEDFPHLQRRARRQRTAVWCASSLGVAALVVLLLPGMPEDQNAAPTLEVELRSVEVQPSPRPMSLGPETLIKPGSKGGPCAQPGSCVPGNADLPDSASMPTG